MLSESTASIQSVNVALEIGRVVTKFADEQLEEAERKREAEDSIVEEQLAAREVAQNDAASDRGAGDGDLDGFGASADSGDSGSGSVANGLLLDIQV